MNNYNDLIIYLDSLQENKIKPGLARINLALDRLNHPERSFKSIHIAGTNGKGSVAVYLEGLIGKSGYKVGLYTSPHLINVRERIQINRVNISEEEMFEVGKEIVDNCEDIKLSYFEFLTLVGFLYFKRGKVDIAVIETGLGGRWDATNVLIPVLSILTPISIDHVSYLGDTLEQIAAEKAEIIKNDIPVVSAVQRSKVLKILRQVAVSRNSEFHILNELVEIEGFLGFKKENASLALKAADCLNKLGFSINVDFKLLKNVSWPGRLQKISEDPEIILDGAHNVAAIKALVDCLREDPSRKKIVVFGAMKDKSLKEMVSLLDEVADAWILTSPCGERAASVEDLRKLVPSQKIKTSSDYNEILKSIEAFGLQNPLVVVTGSLYLIGRILKESRSVIARSL